MSDKTNAQPGESHKRRIFWGLLFGTVILLFLFFVIPNFVDTPLRISEETTILTEPRTPDGRRVDYLAALEKRFGPKNTGENGFREIAAATGRVPMENTSQEYWDELCRKLDIDPYAPPTMPFVVWAERPLHEAAHRESGSEEPFEKPPGVIAALPPELQNSHYAWNYRGDHIRKWQEEYMAKPWCDEDFPELGECIDTLSPFLDLVAQAVRKDTYHIPVAMASSSNMNDILVTCVQLHRNVARYLVIRANRSLQQGDGEAALDDLMTTLRIGCHLQQDIFLVVNLTGYSINSHVYPAFKNLLQQRLLTPGQMRQCIAELQQLPVHRSFEDILLCDQCQNLDSLVFYAYSNPLHFRGSEKRLLGVDWNIVARRLNAYYAKMLELHRTGATPDEIDREFTKFYDEQSQRYPEDSLWTLLSKSYRSNTIGVTSSPGIIVTGYREGIKDAAKRQLLIFALELELEKEQNGRYPATLGFLNDRYTPEQLTDPFGKSPFGYSPTESGDGYLLYSDGQNAIVIEMQ